MGGGASAVRDMEEIVACTFLIGKAIAAVSFPDMYNLYDFQWKKPLAGGTQVLTQQLGEDGNVTYVITTTPLQQKQAGPRSSLAKEQSEAFDEEEEEDEQETSSPPQDAQEGPKEEEEDDGMLTVTVGSDSITIKDPNKANDDGWTPLHACCHSSTTAKAGLALITWVLEHGGKASDFDGKTKRGPGAFNSGWTPLHMASAYGVEALVERLCAVGADANTRNSLSWTPLQEACHRGFLSVIRLLIRGGADVNYIPDDKACRNSPFLRAPAQSPLGEVCRCGFKEAAKVLLDAGALKDQRNSLGWTPLHEAAFFNQLDVVQLLLVYGADPTVRNNQGALPFHLASMPELRTIIREMGGEAATADPPIQPLLGPKLGAQLTSDPQPTGGPAGGLAAADKGESSFSSSSRTLKTRGSKLEPDEEEEEEEAGEEEGEKEEGRGPGEEAQQQQQQQQQGARYLHRGQMLGDLPALDSAATGPRKPQSGPGEGRFAVTEDMKKRHAHHPHDLSRKHSSSSGSKAGLRRADSRAAEDKNVGGGEEEEVPKELICQLCLRPLRHPLRTPYGNVYERDVIKAWLQKNGSIDPLTGQPLALSELKPDQDLAAKIKEFHAQQKAARNEAQRQEAAAEGGEDKKTPAEGRANLHLLKGGSSSGKPTSALSTETSPVSAPQAAVQQQGLADDDLYDF